MPVLARWLERAGHPTVVVTPMPEVAAALGTPRIVGVEFPFGHPFGPAGDAQMHRRVLLTALTVLAGAAGFGTRVDIDAEWPVPLRDAYRSWQPLEPSPIVRQFLERFKASRES